MQVVIDDRNYVNFYDEKGNLVMYMGFVPSFFTWVFKTSDVIKITDDMDLYYYLENFFNQNYIFNNEDLLESVKTSNMMKWYSDTYYDPNNKWSYMAVSYLNIEHDSNYFTLKCVKPLDKLTNHVSKFHCISFAPSGNGVFTRNKVTNSTLQDDFINMVYRELLNKSKLKIRRKNKVDDDI